MKTCELFGAFWKMKCLLWFVEELLHHIPRSSLDLWGNNYNKVSIKTKNNRICLNALGFYTLWYYLQMVWYWVWTYKYFTWYNDLEISLCGGSKKWRVGQWIYVKARKDIVEENWNYLKRKINMVVKIWVRVWWV
jgi:hypothetical protein